MTRKQRRLTIIGGSLAVLAFAAGAGAERIAGFDRVLLDAGDGAEQHMPRRQARSPRRYGGDGSLERGDNLAVSFEVTDGNTTTAGQLQGYSCPICSAKGRASSPRGTSIPAGMFTADTVLAKHDENYMPREVVDTLKKQGHWQEITAPNGANAKAAAK